MDRKIAFHTHIPVTYIPHSAKRTNIYHQFATHYQAYQRDARTLGILTMNAHPFSQELNERVKKHQEKLASVTMRIYQTSGSLDAFRDIMGHLLKHPHSVYHTPLSGNQDLTQLTGVPTTEEAIEHTIKGIGIAAEFATHAQEDSVGVLLTGSLAYSPFFSVKGETPSHVKNHSDRYKGKSDVDLLVVIRDSQQLLTLMKKYVDAGLVDKKELDRSVLFISLYDEKRADTFSIMTDREDMKVSIHCLPLKIFTSICNIDPSQHNVPGSQGALLDFKPDLGFQSDRNNGFVTGDLKGHESVFFPIHHEDIPYPHSQTSAGYITGKTVGWRKSIDTYNQTYVIGVLGSLLLSCPAVLHDSKKTIATSLTTMKNHVQAIMNGSDIAYFPRFDRMTERTQKSLRRHLSPSDRRVLSYS